MTYLLYDALIAIGLALAWGLWIYLWAGAILSKRLRRKNDENYS